MAPRTKPEIAQELEKVTRELNQLRPVAAARMTRIRDLEIERQRAKDILKKVVIDHHCLAGMVHQLRKIFDVELEVNRG
jgi:hypothetical protein